MPARRTAAIAALTLAAGLLAACTSGASGHTGSSSGAPTSASSGAAAATGSAQAVAVALASVRPATAPDTGGTPVALDGSGFSDSSTVLFGTAPATDVRVVSASRLIAWAPPHPAGTVQVRVGGGPAPSLGRFTYTASSTGTEWTVPAQPADAVAVSCSSATACTAISPTSASTWGGSGWSDPQPLPHRAAAVSCASAQACLAVGDGADAWDGQRWAAVSAPHAHLDAVSCPATDTCYAATRAGSLYRRHTGRWTLRAMLPGGITGLSCPDPDTCAVVGPDGTATIVYGAHHVAASHVTSAAFTAVSCSTASFCAAGDDTGAAWFYDGSRWRFKARVAGSTLAAVDCESASFCVGLSSSGVYRWDGHAVSDEPDTGLSATGAGVDAVSCGSSRFCVAVRR